MSLLLSNAIVTITRRGGVTVLSNARAAIAPSKYINTPDGPMQQRVIQLDPATSTSAMPAAGDTVLIVSRVGQPYAPQMKAIISDVDTPSDATGTLAVIKLTINGGLLPA